MDNKDLLKKEALEAAEIAEDDLDEVAGGFVRQVASSYQTTGNGGGYQGAGQYKDAGQYQGAGQYKDAGQYQNAGTYRATGGFQGMGDIPKSPQNTQNKK